MIFLSFKVGCLRYKEMRFLAGGGSAWIFLSCHWQKFNFPGDWDAEIHLEAIRRLKLIAVPGRPGKMM